jgi:ribosomal protein S18 acetylase RimI-like enzyme
MSTPAALGEISSSSLWLEPQPFETEFLGGPVFRLDVETATRPEALERGVPDLLRRARAAGARLVSCRLRAACQPLIDALVAIDFREIETLLTFERALSDLPPRPAGLDAALARPRDAAACIAIARTAFTTDRFHADPRIARAAADALKARWVENGLNGRADATFVARDRGRTVGFNLCLLRGDFAVIDLIAVRPDAQGRGFGRALVAESLHHYAPVVRAMRVGTQATNAASIGLYRSMGFVPVDEAVTLHWIPAPEC